MTELHRLEDHVLGSKLGAFGRSLPALESDAFAAGVRARLGAASDRARRRSWAPLAAAAASALLLVTAALVASPSLRDAVADRLGIGGVDVEMVGRIPPDIGTRLDLGRPVTLGLARSRASFPVLVPAALGEPDLVFTGRPVAGGVVLAYRARPELPEVGDTGLGALVMQFSGRVGEGEARASVATKVVGEESELAFTEVGGAPAYWISGDPHLVIFRDSRGTVRGDRTRLAGNVLLFERDGITFRLESQLGLPGARRIAASLR